MSGERNGAESREATTAWKKWAWAALIAATLYVCYFSHLGAIGFVEPDEPRYAWVARAMAETGDWVTPRLYGKPWFEKPVLYYWGAATAFKLLGASEAAARLPSAVSALFATLAMGWLAWRMYGPATARLLLVMLPTSIGMIGFSHAGSTDMPFSGMLTVAMVAAAVAVGDVPSGAGAETRKPWGALVAFGVFLGAAVLAKGPAAIVLAGGATALWALVTQRWRDAFRLAHPAAIAAFCVTALPWYLLCALWNPDFLRVFILEHNFERYLTPVFRHEQPFWYYGPVVLLGLLPWTILIIFGRRAGRVFREEAWPSSHQILIACWAVFPILFFSLSKSKLPGYALPSLPAFVFLLSIPFSRAIQAKERQGRWMVAGAGLILLILGIAGALYEKRIPGGEDLLPAPWQVGMISAAVAGGSLSLVLAFLKKIVPAGIAVVLTVVLLVHTLGGALPLLDPVYSPRVAAGNAPKQYPGFVAGEASVYHLRRGLHYGLSYYLRRELPAWAGDEPRPRWVFAPYKESVALERIGFACQKSPLVFPAVVICAAPAASADGTSGGWKPQ